MSDKHSPTPFFDPTPELLSNDAQQLQLSKAISFTTYAKQLPSLEIQDSAEDSQCLQQKPVANAQKYCNFDEIISKVRKDHQSKQNLFEQIMLNRGDEIYQLTKFPAYGISNKVNSSEVNNEEQKKQSETKEETNFEKNVITVEQKEQKTQEIEQIEENLVITNPNISEAKQESTETRLSCNCKKSHCIKLYCECFNRNLMCNDSCKCTDCKNRPQFQAKREKAIQYLLKKTQLSSENNQNINNHDLNELLGKNKEGCNCSKSHCVKKYCECFNNGKKCSDKCKCISCKNGGPNCFIEEDAKKLDMQVENQAGGAAYNLRKKVKKSEEIQQ